VAKATTFPETGLLSSGWNRKNSVVCFYLSSPSRNIKTQAASVIMAEDTPPRVGEPVESTAGNPAARTGVVIYHIGHETIWLFYAAALLCSVVREPNPCAGKRSTSSGSSDL
jgi:hypothetical protein